MIPPRYSSAYLWLLSLLEESLLGLLLLALLLGEVVGGGRLLDGLLVNAANIDARAGRDHVAGIHPSEGNTIDLEGASDEEDTLVEVLEEDDTLATETAGEEDQNGARLEAFPQLGWADGLASLYPSTCQRIVPQLHCGINRCHVIQDVIRCCMSTASPNAAVAVAERAFLDFNPSLGSTDFLGLWLFVNGIPLRGLVLRLRNGPLALSKLLRLANSRVRHIGCWGRRRLDKKVWEREGVVDGGWLMGVKVVTGALRAHGNDGVCGNRSPIH